MRTSNKFKTNDAMEDFQLFDENLAEIPLKEGIPEAYQKQYSIPGAIKYHAYHGKLPMLFQAIRIGPFESVCSDYLTNYDAKLTCKANVNCIEFHSLLTGTVQYQQKGFNWTGLDAGHYNMIALSTVKNQVHFMAPPLCTFDLHFSKEKLIEWAKKYPKLKTLIKALNAHGQQSLFDKPQIITIDMLQLIFKIRVALFAGKADAPMTIQMVENLMVLVLGKGKKKTKYRYSYEDVTRLNHAHELLAEYLDESDILARQLLKSRMKPDKFREGFKAIFQTLPSQYLTSCRLQLAKEVAEGGTVYKIIDLARMSGYTSAQHLAKAFQKRFGIKLSDILKENRKDR